MTTLPPVVGVLVGDNSNYLASLNEAERATKGSTDKSAGHFSKLGGIMGTALKVGAAAGIGAIGAFAVKAISGASDMAETMSKVGVVFGDQAAQVTGFANQMAKDFGTPKTAILDAASSIGLIGKASGLSQADAGKMSTELAKLAADASSFYNVPLPEALAAIQSGLVGEAEPMRRFGVLLNEQAVSAEAARLGLAKTNGEYSEGAKAQARASLIMSGMKDASGDLERTQGSLSNRMRELKGRAENFAASVGTAVIPMLLKFMDFGEKVGAKVGPAIKGVFDILAKGDFTGAFGKALGVEEDAPIVGFILKIRNAVIGLFELFTKGDFTGALRKAFNVEEDSPLVAKLLAMREAVIGFVTGVVSFVRQHWPDIQNVITGVFTTVRGVVEGTLNVIIPLIEKIAPIAKDAFGTVADTIGNVGRVLGDNRETIEKVATIIGTVLIPAFVLLGVEAGISAVRQAAAWVMAQLAAIEAAVVHVAQIGIMIAKWVVMGAVAMAQATIIAAAWLISLGPIALVVAAVVGLAVAFVANWDTIRSAVLTGVMFVADKFLGMVQTVVEAAAAAFGWVPGIGPKLSDAANRVAEFRNDVNESLRGIRDRDVTVTITQVRRFIDDPGTAARKAAGSYGPAYHSGGIIAGPRGADVPMLGQAGEGVFTRGQMAAMGLALGSAGGGSGSGRGGATYNTVNVYTATGDIPADTMRKIRAQFYEMGNDLPPGSILPGG